MSIPIRATRPAAKFKARPKPWRCYAGGHEFNKPKKGKCPYCNSRNIRRIQEAT